MIFLFFKKNFVKVVISFVEVRCCRYGIFMQLLLLCFLLSPAPSNAVETVHPKPFFRSQLLTGFTKAKQTVEISSEVSGKCTAVHARIGGPLPQSGVLAEIASTYVQLDLKANRLEVESVQRQLATENKMLERYTSLRKENGATEAKLDEVTLSTDLHEMRLKTLENQYQRLQETLDRHTIKGPAGWIMIDRMVEPGEYVRSGDTIAQIGDFTELIIPFALSFHELQILQKNNNIAIYFPDLGFQVQGQIYRISPIFSETTKKIPVDVIVNATHGDQRLRGGLRAEIHLKKQKKDTFTLPVSAVLSRYDAYWVVKENGERLKVLFLGTTDNGASVIISSQKLHKTDTVFAVVPEDF